MIGENPGGGGDGEGDSEEETDVELSARGPQAGGCGSRSFLTCLRWKVMALITSLWVEKPT